MKSILSQNTIRGIKEKRIVFYGFYILSEIFNRNLKLMVSVAVRYTVQNTEHVHSMPKVCSLKVEYDLS